MTNNNGNSNNGSTRVSGVSTRVGSTSGGNRAAGVGSTGGRTMGTGGVDGIPDSDTPAAMTSAASEAGDPANINPDAEVMESVNKQREEAGMPRLDDMVATHHQARLGNPRQQLLARAQAQVFCQVRQDQPALAAGLQVGRQTCQKALEHAAAFVVHGVFDGGVGAPRALAWSAASG